MKELLKDKGFTEEQLKIILEAHSEKLKNAFIPLDRFNEINEKLKAEALKVKERDAQITELGKSDVEGMKEQIKKLQEENKLKDKTAQEALEKERKKNAAKLAWLEDEEFKALDLDYILEKTDLSLIKFDETTGKISSGFKEQRDNLVKERAGLFEAKTKEASGIKGGKFLGNEPADGDKKNKDAGELSLGAQLAKRKAEKQPVKTLESINPWATN